MPEVTVNIRMRVIRQNEAHYDLRLLPIRPDSQREEPEDNSSLPKLRYMVPSRTNIRPQSHYEFLSFSSVDTQPIS